MTQPEFILDIIKNLIFLSTSVYSLEKNKRLSKIFLKFPSKFFVFTNQASLGSKKIFLVTKKISKKFSLLWITNLSSLTLTNQRYLLFRQSWRFISIDTYEAFFVVENLIFLYNNLFINFVSEKCNKKFKEQETNQKCH